MVRPGNLSSAARKTCFSRSVPGRTLWTCSLSPYLLSRISRAISAIVLTVWGGRGIERRETLLGKSVPNLLTGGIICFLTRRHFPCMIARDKTESWK